MYLARLTLTLLMGIGLLGCSTPTKLATLIPASPDRTATDIIAAAHAAAGGESWVRPATLSMRGYAVFYRDGETIRHEDHAMWRVYAQTKNDAHRADGKVRIRSMRDGVAAIDISYDGAVTYNPSGPLPPSDADVRWASNFGFGVIRHALDDGYQLARLPDDFVDGRPAYVIGVTDPSKGETIFAIAQDDASILRVGFDTPRGYHHRIYSNFFSNPGETWQQPGRVRLYYNGVKANEVIWTRYSLQDTLADCLFILPEAENCPSDAWEK